MTTPEHVHIATTLLLAVAALRLTRDPAMEPLSVQAAEEYAYALDVAGLLVSGSVREEWGEGPLVDGEPTHWPIPIKGCIACAEARPTHRRFVTDWETP